MFISYTVIKAETNINYMFVVLNWSYHAYSTYEINDFKQ